MPQAHPIITSFAAGEWSPSMEGRIDLENYRQSCRVLENFICLPQGPAIRRDGTRFINEIKSSLTTARLIPFIHSSVQAYMLEMGNLYCRFYMDQARILSGGVPYEIVTPFTEALLPKIQIVQSADVMYLTTGSLPIYKLSRTAHDSWTLSAVTMEDGPYLDQNADQLVHLTASATTGTGITITAANMYASSTVSTWDGVAGAGDGVMTTTVEKGGLRFKVPNSGLLLSFKINGGGSVADPNLATAYLYSDVAGSPGVLLATSSNTQSMVATGDKEFTFASPALSASTWYWICFDVATPDDGITISTVADDASFGSGHHADTITSITDSLAEEYKTEITYQQTGAASVFESGHVGSRWRMRHTGQTTTKSYASAATVGTALALKGKFIVDITVTTAWIGRIVLQVSYNAITWHDTATFSTSTRQEFTELNNGVYYRLKCMEFSAGSATGAITQVEQWGVFEITAFVSASQVTATVISTIGATDPTPFWREAAWSDVRGYPKTCCFHDDRLIFAATEYQPLMMWCSDVGDYEQHSPESGAMSLNLVRLNSAIQWMTAHTAFAVGTLGEEANLATRKAEAMTADNPPYVDVQSDFGTQVDTVPIGAGPAIVFVQNGGRQIRQFLYNFTYDKYIADDLTFLADHITRGGVAELAYQQTPYSILWGRTDDGKLIGNTFARIGEDVSKGWHRHPLTGAFVESIAVMPSSYSSADARHELWLLVKRTINGSDARYIEVLSDNYNVEDLEDFFYVDCGLTYSGAAATTITGLDHLEGETVAILAGGASQPQQVVSAGAITIDEAATPVHVGLPITSTLQTQRIEAGAADGTAQGRTKEIASVVVRMRNSAGGKLANDPDSTNTMNIVDWLVNEAGLAILPTELFSGDSEPIPWPGPAERDAAITIIQDEPYPMTVLALLPNVVTNE